MAELKTEKKRARHGFRHSGRDSQVRIYLGKQMRFFINESDWKVLPMAAIIAAMVSMVIRKRFFVTKEGALLGGFALACVAIWNGCFNSIQSICRERPIVKREHRSGMHVSSYVIAHMIYQLFLCVLQTILTIYVMVLMEVKIPAQGFITRWMVMDLAISMLLITYASDMLSLFISSISHTTTGAMTIMPFVLIFQLVFSGGLIPLPQWSKSVSNFTISNYGIKVLAAQAGYNQLPMTTAWEMIENMENSEIGGTVTVGEVLDLLNSPGIQKRRDTEVLKSYTVGEVAEILNCADESLHLRELEVMHPASLRSIVESLLNNAELSSLLEREILPDFAGIERKTFGGLLRDMLEDEDMQPLLDIEIGANVNLGQVLDFLHTEEVVRLTADEQLNTSVTLGDIIDFLNGNEAIQAQRDRSFTFKTTVGELLNLFGKENVKDLVMTRTALATQNPEYELSEEKLWNNWLALSGFIALFALLAFVSLKMIDRDKR